MTLARQDRKSTLFQQAERIRSRAKWAARLLADSPKGRLELRRSAYLKVLRSFTDTAEIRFNGSRLLINMFDTPIGYEAFVFGSFDADMMHAATLAMSNYLGPKRSIAGRVFLDIGANIGTTTITAITRWNASLVVAVEPAPENFKLLRCNAIINDLELRVECIQRVVTNRSGPVLLELDRRNWGDHRVRSSTAAGEQGEETRSTIEVQGARLDDLIDAAGIEPENIGLVWIDVQGHEGHVLDSAPDTLSFGVPMVIEYWPYALRRSGGLEMLNEHIKQSFTSFVDLAELEQLQPSVQIASIAMQYRESYSNLLLIP